MVCDIRSEHERYLARNGGRRVCSDHSLHHSIRTTRVTEWLGRWDLLDLDEAADGDEPSSAPGARRRAQGRPQ